MNKYWKNALNKEDSQKIVVFTVCLARHEYSASLKSSFSDKKQKKE